MRYKQIVLEDFVNYKQPSLFIGTISCDWKCCVENNLEKSICQNSELSCSDTLTISNNRLLELFQNNPITKAIVIGGLEPFLQIDEIIELIDLFRKNQENSPFIIYTGYYPNEIENSLNKLKNYNNIIVKFGRYIPNSNTINDKVLGITLASANQWAENIS